METPKTEEQKVSVKKEGDGAEAPKKKKILSAYIMHRMQVTAGRTERNQLEREKHVHKGTRTVTSTGTAGSESGGTCKGSTEAEVS